jgi:broad specificity phosphatase PhoE
VATRLILITPAETVASRQPVFGDDSALPRPSDVRGSLARVGQWLSSPEQVCGETIRRIGGTPQWVPQLAGPDFGAWRGRSLADVAGADPVGLAAWLADAAARPHGGETLTELIARVADFIASREWPDGASVLCATQLVVRAALVAALGLAGDAIFRFDLAPLAGAQISRSGSMWRLQRLGPGLLDQAG